MWVVTGASGFVGGHVLRALEGAGVPARGLGRRDVPAWDARSLTAALAGVEGVVHAASVVHSPSTPPDEYRRFNVEGTEALVTAARAAGVKRLVFTSSIKIHGEMPEGIIDETTPVRAEADYARTKAEAERIVVAAEDLRPVVLRLCPVFGRGDKGNVRTMIEAIWRRRFLLPGDGSTRKSIVHVSTVVDVVRRAAAGRATGVFVVADREAPSIRALAGAIASVLGRRPPFAVPAPALRVAAGVVARAARLAGRSTRVSADLVAKSLTSSVCDPSRVEAAFGVRCHVDLEASLRDEVAWLREIRAIR